jgi:hypothetical protein
MKFPEPPRFVVVAFLFGLVWVSIVWSKGQIREIDRLAVHFLIFVVVGSLLGWTMRIIVRWWHGRK